MDQVLSDWIDGMLAVLGITIDTLLPVWPTHVWDVCEVLPHLDPALTQAAVWEHIHARGEVFWAELSPMPWVDELVALCRGFGPIKILTTPSDHPGSLSGKVQWLHRQFGHGFRDYWIGWNKAELAKPGTVLIDDRPSNCQGFTHAGGRAILFPAVANLHRAHMHDPVPFVRAELEKIFYG